VNKINESNEFFSYLEESKPLTQEETRILKKLQAKLSKSQSINHLIQDEQMNDIRENTEIILNIGCSRNSEEIELVPLIKSQIEILPKK